MTNPAFLVPSAPSLPLQAASSPPHGAAPAVPVELASPPALPPQHPGHPTEHAEDGWNIDWEHQRYRERRSFQARRRRKENVALQAAHELTTALHCNVYMIIERKDDTRAPRRIYHPLRGKRWPPTFEDMWEHDYPEPIVYTPESMGPVRLKTREDRRAPLRLKNGTIAPRQLAVLKTVPDDVQERHRLVSNAEVGAKEQDHPGIPGPTHSGDVELALRPTTPPTNRQQQEDELTGMPSPTMTPTGHGLQDQRQYIGMPTISGGTASYDARRFCLSDVKMNGHVAGRDNVLHGRVQSVSEAARSDLRGARGRGVAAVVPRLRTTVARPHGPSGPRVE